MSHSPVAEHELVTRERFDAWSDSYMFDHVRPWLAYNQRQVLGRIDWARTRRVLDIACGSGYAVYEAGARLRATPGGMACGCDISVAMLGRRTPAGDGAPSRTYFQAASAQALPYATGTFDAVLCTTAFHHFPDPAAALTEIRRILRPGGQLLIGDICRNLSLGTWVWDRLHRWFERAHVQYYRTDELFALFAGAGFEDVALTELAPSYSETKKLVRKFALFRAVAPV